MVMSVRLPRKRTIHNARALSKPWGDMKDKAGGELGEARQAEKNNQHNFDMLKQSLEDKMAANGKDMDEEKAAKAEAEEGKATAEGTTKQQRKPSLRLKRRLKKQTGIACRWRPIMKRQSRAVPTNQQRLHRQRRFWWIHDRSG